MKPLGTIRALSIAALTLGIPGIAAGQSSPVVYGAFIDAAAINSFNSPANHLFRSRGTTPRVDETMVNMAGASVKKPATDASRWGVELSAHAGEDAKVFGFSATAPNMSGADGLRYLGPSNVSYLAPAGRGLTVQGGIFSSLIGYDSLYSKDNLNYSRPWAADFTPFLMMGVNAAYPVTESVTVTGFVVNGYWHLAHANDVPSVGGQMLWTPHQGASLKQTILYGPHQSDTALEFWRFLSDTIAEKTAGRFKAAAELQVSSESESTTRQRAWWVAAQAPVHVTLAGPWSVTIRPELASDTSGRWTTFKQSIVAVTSTLAFRRTVGGTQSLVRLEHRYDHSSGPEGGFFTGAAGLTPHQHLLSLSWILTV